MVDEWVPAACADVRRMLDAGDSDGAALLAGDIEAAAFGRPARRCSACEAPATPGRPWCRGCGPCFIPRPNAQPRRLFWIRIAGHVKAWKKLTAKQRAEIRARREAGGSMRAVAAEYGIHWTYAYLIARTREAG